MISTKHYWTKGDSRIDHSLNGALLKTMLAVLQGRLKVKDVYPRDITFLLHDWVEIEKQRVSGGGPPVFVAECFAYILDAIAFIALKLPGK